MNSETSYEYKPIDELHKIQQSIDAIAGLINSGERSTAFEAVDPWALGGMLEYLAHRMEKSLEEQSQPSER